MEQDMLAGKLAEVDAQLAGVHAKLQSAAQMESTELNSAIAQTREETEQCARALAERLLTPIDSSPFRSSRDCAMRSSPASSRDSACAA